MKIINATNHIYKFDNGETGIDLKSGILNVTLGHNSEVIQKSLTEISNYGFVMTYDQPNTIRENLLSLLDIVIPGYNYHTLSNGTEAVEKAIQSVLIIKGETATRRILYMGGAFHGKSIALSPIKYDVPWASNIDFKPLTAATLEQPFDAILMEPIQGLTGIPFILVDPIKDALKKYNALLIADEAITGFGRCGKMLYGDLFYPDIFMAGKCISQGMPSAIVAVKKTYEFDLPIKWSSTGSFNCLNALIAFHTITRYREMGFYNIELFKLINREVFKDYQMYNYGALFYVKLPGMFDIAERLRKKRIFTDSFGETLRLAPCFTFPLDEYRSILTQIKSEYENNCNRH